MIYPRKMLVLAVFALFAGLTIIANGQNGAPAATTEERVLQLERMVSTLDTQLQLRTNAGGAQDRPTRDFNLNSRLDRIELNVEQLERQVLDLQRQASDALRAANQAQRDAQMAQQIARSAESRSR